MTKKEKHLTRRQFLLLIGAELGVMASGKFLSHLGPKSARASSDNYTTEWAPPGINLKDHTIFWDPESGYYYLCSIHIKLPDEWEDRFVYARSRDLNDWEYLGSVLNQQTPGWWDALCIRAPHMIKQNNEYYNTTKIPEYRTSRSPLGPWSEPFLLVPGWAHEFFHDKNGNLFTSYLTSYTITIRPVLMNNSFDPPRLFIGESLHQIHLPLIQS